MLATIPNMFPQLNINTGPLTGNRDLSALMLMISIHRKSLRRPLTILEIGTHHGHTTALLADVFNEDMLHTIDFPDNQLHGVQVHEVPSQTEVGVLARGRRNVLQLLGDSQNYEYPSSYDVVFIDGDHSYEGVKNDYGNVCGFLNSQALVVFHDVGNPAVPGVTRFLRELNRVIYHFEGTCIGVVSPGKHLLSLILGAHR